MPPGDVSGTIVFETPHSEVLSGVKDGGTYPDVLNEVLSSRRAAGIDRSELLIELYKSKIEDPS